MNVSVRCSPTTFLCETVNAYTLLPFLFNNPSTAEIYTLSLHDALPIYLLRSCGIHIAIAACQQLNCSVVVRSEEHTSELQSRFDLVCRLLLEKKKRHRLLAGGCGAYPRRLISQRGGRRVAAPASVPAFA